MTTAEEIKVEEEEPVKKVIATRVSGTVKWFNVKNGYGFINRDDNKEDIFVHQTAISKNNPKKFLRSVGDGEVVEFDVVSGSKGLEAANVTGPEGNPVQGSKYAPERRRRNYNGYYRGYRRNRRNPRPRQDSATNGEVKEEDQDGKGTESGDNADKPRQRRGRGRPWWMRRRRGPPRRDDQSGGESGEGHTHENGSPHEDGEQRPPQRRRPRYRRPRRPRSDNEERSDDQKEDRREGGEGEGDGDNPPRRRRRFRRYRRRPRSDGEEEQKPPIQDKAAPAPTADAAPEN